MDGCCVIKTDLQTTDANKGTIYERHKDLLLNEDQQNTLNKLNIKPPHNLQSRNFFRGNHVSK